MATFVIPDSPELERVTTGMTPEAKVLVVMTGGTICMEKSPNGLIPARNFVDRCMAPRPEFNDRSEPQPIEVRLQEDGRLVSKQLKGLRTPLSAYGKRIRYTVLEFEELLDSSSIDSRGWAEIAETIHRNYTLFDGFVVLHGTDSLAYTCSALSFMLQNLGKPVILTGSQVPFSERKNDALENLLDSLDIAGHFMIPEVCLCFNSTLFRGNRTTKISASEFEAFASPNLPPVATITAMNTSVSWNLVTRPVALEPFSIQTNLEIHHVACLRIFPGIKAKMVDAVLHTDKLRGLVLETFGAGNAPSGHDNALLTVIADAVHRGIVIVNVTQCLTGSVSSLYRPGMALGQAGVVAGGDMTTEAALTKLSYLLALPGASPERVMRDMATSIRGELTESAGTIFQHPSGTLSSPITQLTAISYAIASGDLEKVKDLLRNDDQLLNRADYSGNTPLHLAATGPNLRILRYLLLLGASVHMRNYTGSGRTPLFLAANAGLTSHVMLLRQAGAHLHSEELDTAHLHANQRPQVWRTAGLEQMCLSESVNGVSDSADLALLRVSRGFYVEYPDPHIKAVGFVRLPVHLRQLASQRVTVPLPVEVVDPESISLTRCWRASDAIVTQSEDASSPPAPPNSTRASPTSGATRPGRHLHLGRLGVSLALSKIPPQMLDF